MSIAERTASEIKRRRERDEMSKKRGQAMFRPTKGWTEPPHATESAAR